jgi:integrase
MIVLMGNTCDAGISFHVACIPEICPMSDVAFSQFEAEVLALYQPPQKRPSTRSKIGQVLHELANYCQVAADLDPVAIGRWLADHPERAAATRKSLLSALRAVCGYGEWRGYLRNPFSFRKLSSWVPSDELEDGEPFRRHRSALEIARVLLKADEEAQDGGWQASRLRAAVYAWAYTGAGLKEILGLRVQDILLQDRVIAVKSHPRRRLKTGARAAWLPIAEPLGRVLEAWLPSAGCDWAFPGSRRHTPWMGGSPGYRPTDRVRQLGERAGVQGLTVLAFRHTFGTLSEDWDIGELMLQRILRHSRPATQRHYRHADPELLQRAAAKIRF